MSNLFWPTDEQFASIEGALPMNRPGVKRGGTARLSAGSSTS
jgi:hypothetical protein